MTDRTGRGAVPPVPVKRITVPANLREACRQFNRGQFFECHETLEEVWQEEQGEVRDLYKGLIQLAAAFVHVTRGNPVGARRLLTTSLGYLTPYRPDGAMGFDADHICRETECALAALERGGDAALDTIVTSLVPRLAIDDAALPGEAIRWRAWGFSAAGEPLEMEVPDNT